MTDCPLNNLQDMLTRFRNCADSIANDSLRRNTLQALDVFRRFVAAEELANARLTATTVGEWVLWLLANAYAPATIRTSLARLSALHGKSLREPAPAQAESELPSAGTASEVTATAASPFAEVSRRLKAYPLDSLSAFADPAIPAKLRTLAHAPLSGQPDLRLGVDALLLALHLGGRSLSQIAALRIAECRELLVTLNEASSVEAEADGGEPEDSASLSAIVERYARPRAAYLLPLSQSQRPPRTILRHLSESITAALRLVGIKATDFADSTPAYLWGMLAMRCGVSATEVGGALADPGIFALAIDKDEVQPTADTPRSEIQSLVSRSLATDAACWYAMQLRPHVEYRALEARMQARKLSFSRIFYPMEEVVRRIGHRLHRSHRPVVAGLLFFQTRPARLPDLFYHIGDLAWGYRTSRRPRAPYAIIPHSSIVRYQQAIGKFTDAVERHPHGTLEIKSGDPVQITGGDLCGHQAIFQRELRTIGRGAAAHERLTYRLLLTAHNQITWTVDLDPRLIAPIANSRPHIAD